MRKNRIFLLSMFFLFLPLFLEAKVYLDVYGTGFKKIIFAAPPFQGKTDRLRMDLPEFLYKDLEFSGFFITTPFSLMDKEMISEGLERTQINFSLWKSLGIEILCKGRFSEEGDRVVVEAFVYDVMEQNLILAKRYSANKDLWRDIIHRLSDDIIQAVTGERGITGLKILFVAKKDDKKEIYLSDIYGYNIKKITNFDSVTLSPTPSPDGRLLAYTSYKTGKPHLWVMDLITGRDIYEEKAEGVTIPHLFLSKKTLVYSHSWSRYSAILSLDLEKKEKKELIKGMGIYTSASFSPDGKKMVFVSDMHGSPQIFLKDLSTGNTKRLTFFGNYNTSPSFSPKGKFITFVSKIEGNLEICLTDEEGSSIKVLTDGGINDSPQFSPCGRYILYSSSKGSGSKISIMLVNGENKKTLKFTGMEESQPRFFPRKEE